MTLLYFLLIIVSVGMSAVAQFLFKLGMSQKGVSLAMSSGDTMQIASSIGLSPYILGGFALYGIGAALWLLVLFKLDLSMAYPFVGLGFLITMAMGIFLLGEQVTLVRILGTILIAVGCILVARSA